MHVYLWVVTVVKVFFRMDGSREVTAKSETFFSEGQKNKFIEDLKTLVPQEEDLVNWDCKAYEVTINLGIEE